jgi:hypothetical protein
MADDLKRRDLPPGEVIMRQLLAEADKEQPRERRGVVWRRVGFDDGALGRWLMRFGNEDLGKADTARRLEMRVQLRAWLTLSETPAADRPLYRTVPSPTPASAVDEQVLLQANAWLHDILTKPTHPGAPALVAFNLTGRIDFARHRSGWALLSTLEGSDTDKFQFFAYGALTAYRSGLKLCQRCSKIFLPHGRQAYCSKRCSNTERTTRYRRRKRSRKTDD